MQPTQTSLFGPSRGRAFGSGWGSIFGVLLAASMGTACDAPKPPPPPPWADVEPLGTALVNARLWTVTDADSDPWASERPPSFDCPDYAIEVEPGGLEIDTGDCDYATIQQPSLSAKNFKHIARGSEMLICASGRHLF